MHVQDQVTIEMLSAMHQTQPYIICACMMWCNQTLVENSKMPIFGDFQYFQLSFHNSPDCFSENV
jgi:hypothetical protein